MPVETARNEALETEHDGRDGVRQAARSSNGKAMEGQRPAFMCAYWQPCEPAPSATRLRLDQHLDMSGASCKFSSFTSSKVSWYSFRTRCVHYAETQKNSDDVEIRSQKGGNLIAARSNALVYCGSAIQRRCTVYRYPENHSHCH